MNRSEFLAAVKGKPVPYTAPSGAVVDLRPITLPERLALFAWHDTHKDDADYAQLLRDQYFALGVCDKEGDSIFKPEECRTIGVGAVDFDAIADEVARRSLLSQKKGDDAGKDLPATPN